jgi:hypothetical protein
MHNRITTKKHFKKIESNKGTYRRWYCNMVDHHWFWRGGATTTPTIFLKLFPRYEEIL